MCPDRETLSAFADNEIESDFSHTIESHLTGCLSCARVFEQLKELSRAARYFPVNIDAVQADVWNRITGSLDSKKPAPFWHRNISIPVPAFAAAAAVFILVTAFSIFSLFISVSVNNSYSGISVIESVPITAEDDFKYFQYDQILNVDLKLPENTIFIISGTPQLIKEVDYINRTR